MKLENGNIEIFLQYVKEENLSHVVIRKTYQKEYLPILLRWVENELKIIDVDLSKKKSPKRKKQYIEDYIINKENEHHYIRRYLVYYAGKLDYPKMFLRYEKNGFGFPEGRIDYKRKINNKIKKAGGVIIFYAGIRDALINKVFKGELHGNILLLDGLYKRYEEILKDIRSERHLDERQGFKLETLAQRLKWKPDRIKELKGHIQILYDQKQIGFNNIDDVIAGREKPFFSNDDENKAAISLLMLWAKKDFIIDVIKEYKGRPGFEYYRIEAAFNRNSKTKNFNRGSLHSAWSQYNNKKNKNAKSKMEYFERILIK